MVRWIIGGALVGLICGLEVGALVGLVDYHFIDRDHAIPPEWTAAASALYCAPHGIIAGILFAAPLHQSE